MGKVYQRFAARVASIPTKELVAALIKLLKNSAEVFLPDIIVECQGRCAYVFSKDD